MASTGTSFSTTLAVQLHAICIQHNKSTDLAFHRSHGQNLPISQTRAVWEQYIFEVKGESSSPVQ